MILILIRILILIPISIRITSLSSRYLGRLGRLEYIDKLGISEITELSIISLSPLVSIFIVMLVIRSKPSDSPICLIFFLSPFILFNLILFSACCPTSPPYLSLR